MSIGTFDVDAVLGRAAEYPCRRDIHDKTESAHTQYQFAVDVVRFVEAVECPVHHPGSDQPEGERVQQGRQNFEAVIAEGALYGGSPAGECMATRARAIDAASVSICPAWARSAKLPDGMPPTISASI